MMKMRYLNHPYSMNEILMTAIIKRQRARLYNQKAKITAKRFMYKNPDTFQKDRQFPLRFYIQKAIHFTL